MTEKDHMKTQNHYLFKKDMQHIHTEKHKNTKMTGKGNQSARVYVLGESKRLWRDAVQLQRWTVYKEKHKLPRNQAKQLNWDTKTNTKGRMNK